MRYCPQCGYPQGRGRPDYDDSVAQGGEVLPIDDDSVMNVFDADLSDLSYIKPDTPWWKIW